MPYLRRSATACIDRTGAPRPKSALSSSEEESIVEHRRDKQQSGSADPQRMNTVRPSSAHRGQTQKECAGKTDRWEGGGLANSRRAFGGKRGRGVGSIIKYYSRIRIIRHRREPGQGGELCGLANYADWTSIKGKCGKRSFNCGWHILHHKQLHQRKKSVIFAPQHPKLGCLLLDRSLPAATSGRRPQHPPATSGELSGLKMYRNSCLGAKPGWRIMRIGELSGGELRGFTYCVKHRQKNREPRQSGELSGFACSPCW